MQVPEHERKAGLAGVAATRSFPPGTGGRIAEEGPVVLLPVVVTGQAKAKRDDGEEGDQEPDHGQLEVAKSKPGREERGEGRIRENIGAGKAGPGGGGEESRVRNDRQRRLDPPGEPAFSVAGT